MRRRQDSDSVSLRTDHFGRSLETKLREKEAGSFQKGQTLGPQVPNVNHAIRRRDDCDSSNSSGSASRFRWPAAPLLLSEHGEVDTDGEQKAKQKTGAQVLPNLHKFAGSKPLPVPQRRVVEVSEKGGREDCLEHPKPGPRQEVAQVGGKEKNSTNNSLK